MVLKTGEIRVFQITDRILQQKANSLANTLGKHNFTIVRPVGFKGLDKVLCCQPLAYHSIRSTVD